MKPGISVIAEFHRLFPAVFLRIESGSHEKITRQILMHEVDVGILPDAPEDSRFRRSKLLPNDVIAIVPSDHPLAKCKSVSLSDIVQEQMIFRSRGSSSQRAVNKEFNNLGFTPNPSLTLDSREGVIEAVVAGMGIGFVWRSTAEHVKGIQRLAIEEFASPHSETLFALTQNVSETLKAFFASAEIWVERNEKM